MMGKSKNYLVIPSLDLKQFINENSIIPKKNNDDCLNLFIYPDDKEKTWYYLNKGKSIDLKKYCNNFDMIKEVIK